MFSTMEKMEMSRWSRVLESDEDEKIEITYELNDKDSKDDELYVEKDGIKMNFDDMLEELGEMGKFQLITYILVCFPVVFSGANSLSYVFTAGIPNYRCYIPTCDNTETPKYDEPWLSVAIPPKASGFAGNSYVPDHCSMYKINSTHIYTNLDSISKICSPDMFTEQTERCEKFVFDEERTIVKDWNITCLDNQWKLSMVGTVHFIGIILGSAFFGFMADKFGRKLIFILCILLMGISGAAQVLAPGYVSFQIFIFINSLGTAGVYPLAFIIGVELVGRKKREMTGIVLNYFYAIGEALVALFAWMTLDWTHVQLIVSVPCAIFVVYYWLIPESVRWLLVQQKSSAAKCIVCRAAKMNGVVLSDSLLKTFNDNTPKRDDVLPSGGEEEEPEVVVGILQGVKIMARSKKMIVRFSIVLFLWAVNAFIYYGLSLNSTSIGGNKYLNFGLVCLIEIPGYTIAWISIRHIGRRWSLIASLLLCGLTCIISIFIPEQMSWAVITLFLSGKLGITTSFGVIYVYTAELLPTVIRSGGVGAASTTGRFGALLAPFVPLLGVYVYSLPMILFGIVSIIAGLLALKLPETLGMRLPETIEEAVEL